MVNHRAEHGSKTWPLDTLGFGGDYNPEQWSREVWDDDIRLMREAGVTMVTLGVFSWASLEVADGVFEWEWLDDIIGRLDAAGIAVDLATPSAAPPHWLLTAHPEVLPVTDTMEQVHPGGRLGWCPSSAVFRAYAVRFASALAQRYGSHPAVTMWHVSNELGGGNARCYCDTSGDRFRAWLQERYATIDEVNEAWGAAFWGHTFTAFDEIVPPRGGHPAVNPGLHLDYARFSSDELLAHYVAERDAIRAHSAAPVTTNLMVNAGGAVADYATWARELDILANDHYTIVADPDRHIELSMSADRMRGLSEGQPWMLMEHSTGAPSWQKKNRAKEPGEIARNALAHVARGSESAMFFQWRASTAGAEQFHSAMVPHAGEDSRVFREIRALGAALGRGDGLVGSVVPRARVAIVSDVESAWALEYGLKPHRALSYAREQLAWYGALWRRGIPVDVLPADASFDGYDLVVLPTVFIGSEQRRAALAAHLDGGGSAVVTYQSGIVDTTGRVVGGGYPGFYRELLGVRVEEFRPLQDDEQAVLSDGSVVHEWIEDIQLAGAETILSIAQGPAGAGPAVTRRELPNGGAAWYVGAMLPDTAVADLADRLIAEAGLAPIADCAPELEVVERVRDDESWVFLINHGDKEERIRDLAGRDLVTDAQWGPESAVPAGGCAIIHRTRA